MPADRFVDRKDLRFLTTKLEKVFPIQRHAKSKGPANPLLVENLLPMSPAKTEPSAALEDRGCLFLRDGRIGLQVITDVAAQSRFGYRGLNTDEASAMLLYLCDVHNLGHALQLAQGENVKLIAALKAHRREGGPTPKEAREAEALLAAIDLDQQTTEALKEAQSK